jgi:CMP-N-acetylneuraminic acid synthetase
MYMVNTRKCLRIFDRVYVSSDDVEILRQIDSIGAIPIYRDESLCGDTPSVPVFRHAAQFMEDFDGIISVQVNSPNVEPNTITTVKKIAEMGASEVMTCHPNYSIYGSVWAIRKDRLESYDDFYRPRPDVLVLDRSVDIHTLDEYKEALKCL